MKTSSYRKLLTSSESSIPAAMKKVMMMKKKKKKKKKRLNMNYCGVHRSRSAEPMCLNGFQDFQMVMVETGGGEAGTGLVPGNSVQVISSRGLHSETALLPREEKGFDDTIGVSLRQHHGGL
ncbi:hypothetical protein ACLB2K_016525 [Fragaria x ananassa]